MRISVDELSEARARALSAFNDFGLKFHPDEAIGNRPHLQGGERATHDLDAVVSNSREDRFEVLLRIDQGIGSPKLRDKMGV